MKKGEKVYNVYYYWTVEYGKGSKNICVVVRNNEREEFKLEIEKLRSRNNSQYYCTSPQLLFSNLTLSQAETAKAVAENRMLPDENTFLLK